MKTITTQLFLLIAVCLTSCDHTAELSTKVREDGSLFKTIVLLEAEPSSARNNYFGISTANGWTMEEAPSGVEGKSEKKKFVFSREFNSYQEFNDALFHQQDTLFSIRAEFETEFRWFFTYYHFSETFGAADRFRNIRQSDYFTREDYAFIDRLPANGEPVSKPDSLFAELLNKKIMDVYAINGILEDQIYFLKERIDTYNLDPAWKDTLEFHKPAMYNMVRGENAENLENDAFLAFADSLGVPFPYPEIQNDFNSALERQEKTLNFMSWVTDGTYTNQIEMPWTVVESNADEIKGNLLSWSPPTIKLLLQDYSMRVSSRKTNYWAIILTAVVMLAGGVILFRKR